MVELIDLGLAFTTQSTELQTTELMLTFRVSTYLQNLHKNIIIKIFKALPTVPGMWNVFNKYYFLSLRQFYGGTGKRMKTLFIYLCTEVFKTMLSQYMGSTQRHCSRLAAGGPALPCLPESHPGLQEPTSRLLTSTRRSSWKNQTARGTLVRLGATMKRGPVRHLETSTTPATTQPTAVWLHGPSLLSEATRGGGGGSRQAPWAAEARKGAVGQAVGGQSRLVQGGHTRGRGPRSSIFHTNEPESTGTFHSGAFPWHDFEFPHTYANSSPPQPPLEARTPESAEKDPPHAMQK